ncbi:uncharacterized protein PAC_03482 [Phialocephala subalpina]|uniref:Zn(2)-C6 fungal-type domain-containing protein n=1 Tax=Phialocephala subalpina TaxID=576137 RepID=A0A1L7WLE5_9HELO|nr:uncharacterized protein PAC_03482 [Phialocephala subalpina]
MRVIKVYIPIAGVNVDEGAKNSLWAATAKGVGARLASEFPSPVEKNPTHHVDRIRRVKCDESRPACKRCVSTGRVCDGYGIWGGGGNGYSQRSASNSSIESSPAMTLVPASQNNVPASITVTCMSTHEQYCFEWFMCRTVKKFPGLLPSPFWETLVCQASSSEPAVLHAVLALSSAHKKDGLDSNGPLKIQNTPDTLEQFMLQQYSTAINHLQPHFSAKSRDSIRVALVTCLLFIYMEFLRGHYKTANAHLRSGLKLLREVQEQERSSQKIDGILIPKPCSNFADDCISDTFVRLQIQAMLCGQTFPNLNLIPQTIESDFPNATFQSVGQARQCLDRLSHGIFHLTEKSLQDGISEDLASLACQARLQTAMASWFKQYEAYRFSQGDQMLLRDEFSYRALLLSYTLASIMANTCLSSASQAVFDSQMQSFLSIVNQSIVIRKYVMSTPVHDIIPGTSADASDAVAELGWIPPLSYTAIKCRNHRVRLQAARLLGSLPHKEGMWDATIWASIAKEVVEIEEGDFYENIQVDDDFLLCDVPQEKDLLLPMLPEERRMHEIQVVLPDNPMEKVLLTCRRRRKDGSWEEVVRECDIVPLARVVKPGRTML